MTQSQLPSALLRRARAWAGVLTKNARGYAPNHLKPYIHSKAQELEPGRIVITITADRGANPTNKQHPNYGSSDARAQEYGSGIHAKSKKYIIIAPKTSPFLEFLGTNGFDGWLIRTQQVKHPGIKAANNGKGYIRPAINDIRNRLDELKKDAHDAIVMDIRRSFGMK